jgi:hypothetical protein
MADEGTISWGDTASILAPAYDAFAVTPGTPYTTGATSNKVARALYVGTAGNIILTTERGNIATFLNVTTSFILPVRHTGVISTSTTASGLVALY